jgi:hypothetical protein
MEFQALPCLLAALPQTQAFPVCYQEEDSSEQRPDDNQLTSCLELGCQDTGRNGLRQGIQCRLGTGEELLACLLKLFTLMILSPELSSWGVGHEGQA